MAGPKRRVLKGHISTLETHITDSNMDDVRSCLSSILVSAWFMNGAPVVQVRAQWEGPRDPKSRWVPNIREEWSSDPVRWPLRRGGLRQAVRAALTAAWDTSGARTAQRDDQPTLPGLESRTGPWTLPEPTPAAPALAPAQPSAPPAGATGEKRTRRKRA